MKKTGRSFWKNASRETLALIFFGLALVFATLAVYARVSGFGFISFDDPSYVTENPFVKAGLTLPGVYWAFTSLAVDNWHPVTWLSLMLDCQLFGLNPGAQHLVNLFFHLSAALLLFLAFNRMTGKPWRSLLIAGIFALHPLHVESVAWISERKDVLSAFFGMLTLLLYARYAEAPGLRRYLFMAAAFALGLMAKPMLVTFPCVLLLMDFWPLRRIAWPFDRKAVRRLLLEKAPLLALSAVSGLLTIFAHEDFEQKLPVALLPFPGRLANAFVTTVAYLEKTLAPVDLAVLYPYHPAAVTGVLGAAALLAAITLAALKTARRRPYFITGWLWCLGMLVPVSGLLRNGAQLMADRFMYLPMIGLSLALVWGIAEATEARRLPRAGAVFFSGAALLACALVSYQQAGYWKDSQTLYGHALAVTTDNVFVYNILGMDLAREGRTAEAIKQYRAAIAIYPGYADPHDNLGLALARQGRLAEAAAELLQAIALKKRDPEGEGGLCLVLYRQGKLNAAAAHCREALRFAPDAAAAHNTLGMIFGQSGHVPEAIEEFTRAAALSPGGDADSQNNLCAAYYGLGRFDEALPRCREALRLRPDFPQAQTNLDTVLAAEKTGIAR